MTPQQLLQTLEPLTHSDRVRQMIQMGQRSRQDATVADTLNQLAQGNFYERYLALQSCHSSRNIQIVPRSLVDPSQQIRAVALRLLALFGEDERVRSTLETLPPKAKRKLLHRLLGQKRQPVVDQYLAQLAVSDPAQFLQLWHFGSAGLVFQQIDSLLQQGSAIEWPHLARRHPQLTVQALQQAEPNAPDFRLLYQVNAVLPQLARQCPAEAIALCRALLQTIALSQIDLCLLIRCCPNLAAELVLHERATHLVKIAVCLGKRLPALGGLVEILERVIQTLPDQYVVLAGLTVLANHHRDRLHTLIPQLIRQDKSWITQPIVQSYLHRYRQDLLTPFLQRQSYPGRFSTGNTYTVPSVTDGFHRWTPIQQQHPDMLWIAEDGISGQFSYNEYDTDKLYYVQNLADLVNLETTLAGQADDRLRSLAVTALETQATTDGWTAERRSRLAHYQSDPAVQVAAKAQFLFPPESVMPELASLSQQSR